MKRLDYLDYAKGTAILLVVLAHIYAFNTDISRGIVITWIYSFHMPLFFIISGLLMKLKHNELNKETIIKRFKGIIIPYFLFSSLAIIVNQILYGINVKQAIKETLLTISGVGIDVLWFLPALFFGEVLLLLLNKYIKNINIRLYFILVIGILATFITKENGVILVFVARIMISMLFISIGYYLYNIIINRNISIIQLTILIIVQAILSNINRFVDLNNLVLGNIFLYFINSCIGTIIIINLCRRISKSNILSYLGKNSIVILGFHMNLIYLFLRITNYNLNYLSGVIFTFILIIMQIPIIQFYNLFIKRLFKLNHN